MMDPTMWLRELANSMGFNLCYMQNCVSLETTYGVDPFASEIHNDQTKFWMCEQCHYERLMDV